jgi:hypothetical protein
MHWRKSLRGSCRASRRSVREGRIYRDEFASTYLQYSHLSLPVTSDSPVTCCADIATNPNVGTMGFTPPNGNCTAWSTRNSGGLTRSVPSLQHRLYTRSSLLPARTLVRHHLLTAPSIARHSCLNSATYAQAIAGCAAVNARLCTSAEVVDNCGAGTGCQFDAQAVYVAVAATALFGVYRESAQSSHSLTARALSHMQVDQHGERAVQYGTYVCADVCPQRCPNCRADSV